MVRFVKSLKMVRPNLPVVLLDERHTRRDVPLPEGVDQIVSVASFDKLPYAIDQLLRKAGESRPA